MRDPYDWGPADWAVVFAGVGFTLAFIVIVLLYLLGPIK